MQGKEETKSVMGNLFAPAPEDKADLCLRSNDGHEFHVHSIVLMARSVVFRQVSDLGKSKKPLDIDVKGDDLDIFLRLNLHVLQ